MSVEGPLSQRGTFMFQAYHAYERIGVREHAAVFNCHFRTLNCDVEILEQIADFLNLRGRRVISEVDAVAAEFVVRWRLAVVPAVSEERAVVFVAHGDCLVSEVPDESALEKFLAARQVKVLVNGAERVAHGVRKLAEDHRLVAVLSQEFFDCCGRCVHL